MEALPSHPFADLFALLPPDSIPKWTGVVELLRRWGDEAEPRESVTTTDQWLEKLSGARELLRETEHQLVKLYFDRLLQDLADTSSSPSVGVGEVAGEVCEGVDSGEDDEICRMLMKALNLEEGSSGQDRSGADDFDSIEKSFGEDEQNQETCHQAIDGACSRDEPSELSSQLDVREMEEALDFQPLETCHRAIRLRDSGIGRCGDADECDHGASYQAGGVRHQALEDLERSRNIILFGNPRIELQGATIDQDIETPHLALQPPLQAPLDHDHNPLQADGVQAGNLRDISPEADGHAGFDRGASTHPAT